MKHLLVVYHWDPSTGPLLPVHRDTIWSFRRYSGRRCLYLNTANPSVPEYMRLTDFDLVVFHNTFTARRYGEQEFDELTAHIAFLRDVRAPKILLASDEHWRTDQLVAFIRSFDITHVFTFAPHHARQHIYEGVDLSKVAFHSVVPSYVAESTARKLRRRVERVASRPIDIGCRYSWYPSLGQQGYLRRQIVEVFEGRADCQGLVADVSCDARDALLGRQWFDFLLSCRFVLGVETGSSLLDRDGSVMRESLKYLSEHPNATFAEVEAACFPGLDGNFDYRSIAPRHLEAVLTKTGQVLVEGDYSGVLRPEEHYIEVKRDFSNVESVIEQVKDEKARLAMVERAYKDVVLSGKYTYRAFVAQIMDELLPENAEPSCFRLGCRVSAPVLWNRLDHLRWQASVRMSASVRVSGRLKRRWHRVLSRTRPLVSSLLGEERLRRVLAHMRGSQKS